MKIFTFSKVIFVTILVTTSIQAQSYTRQQENSLLNAYLSSPRTVAPSFHPHLFGNYFGNTKTALTDRNFPLQLAGIGATALIIGSGLDYRLEHYFNQHPGYGKAATPVVISGNTLPILAGGSLFLSAKLAKNNETLGASYAVLQSSLTTLLYVSLLKAITGRPHPDWQHYSDMKKLSRKFRFGFMHGGIFWGWPSGHTAATVAVTSALINYYPHKTWLKIGGYSLIAYTVFGVTAFHRGGMHWFSDAIAAVLMTYPIGATIGKYYRNTYNNATSNTSHANQIKFQGLAFDGLHLSVGWSF